MNSDARATVLALLICTFAIVSIFQWRYYFINVPMYCEMSGVTNASFGMFVANAIITVAFGYGLKLVNDLMKR